MENGGSRSQARAEATEMLRASGVLSQKQNNLLPFQNCDAVLALHSLLCLLRTGFRVGWAQGLLGMFTRFLTLLPASSPAADLTPNLGFHSVHLSVLGRVKSQELRPKSES